MKTESSVWITVVYGTATVLYSKGTVLSSTVLYESVQYPVVQYSIVQSCNIQYISVEYSIVKNSLPIKHSIVQYRTVN